MVQIRFSRFDCFAHLPHPPNKPSQLPSLLQYCLNGFNVRIPVHAVRQQLIGVEQLRDLMEIVLLSTLLAVPSSTLRGNLAHAVQLFLNRVQLPLLLLPLIQ